jgi:hypothetical protein
MPAIDTPAPRRARIMSGPAICRDVRLQSSRLPRALVDVERPQHCEPYGRIAGNRNRHRGKSAAAAFGTAKGSTLGVGSYRNSGNANRRQKRAFAGQDSRLSPPPLNHRRAANTDAPRAVLSTRRESPATGHCRRMTSVRSMMPPKARALRRAGAAIAIACPCNGARGQSLQRPRSIANTPPARTGQKVVQSVPSDNGLKRVSWGTGR